MSQDYQLKGNQFSLFRNWFSLLGLVVALGSLFSFVLLFALDAMSKSPSPYLGILTFVVAPLFLAGGLFLILIGWLLQRRYAIKKAAGTPPPFLSIDLSRASDRRNLAVFALGALLFFGFATLGSYHTYHFAESVQFCGTTCHTPMKPEYTTYLHSPHARVGCTECHVGPGVDAFVKAKLNGAHQLYGVLANNYHRPIPTPVKGLPVVQKTCEQCHWPDKYVGNLDRTYVHFLSDETNTRFATRLSLKVGGGDPTHGPVGGIHWHMNLANSVEYVSSDERNQKIPYVRFTNSKGEKQEYVAGDFKFDPTKHQLRKMDCMDCHNRPAHQMQAPSESVDLVLSAGKVDPSIKLIKSNLVAVLSQTYKTEPEGLKNIHDTLHKLYPTQSSIESIVVAAQEIFSQNIFPEMNASWKNYPNNIGHKAWPGCFRCHDGEHKTADKKSSIGASDCNACHTMLAQGTGAELDKLDAKGMKFAHPDTSTDGTDPNCFTCHAPEI